VEGKKRLALEKESVWGIYKGNLDGRLQRYREKQQMFFAFFFFDENISGMGSVKKKKRKKISLVCAYLFYFLLLRMFDNIVLGKAKTI